MAENLELKAGRYLVEGRVTVLQVDLERGRGRFAVRGSDIDPYIVHYSGEWICDCPARVPVCAHILACQTIAKFDAVERLYRENDDELSGLLREALG